MVKVYGKPNCVQCTATQKALDKLGIPYEYHDLTKEPEKYEEFVAQGFKQAPIVQNNSEIWTGFIPEKLKHIAA